MREVLFRAWNEKEHKFYYFKDGRYYSDAECKHCISERICREFTWRNAEHVTTEEDCNGVKIFEGDIIENDEIDGQGFGEVFQFSDGNWCFDTWCSSAISLAQRGHGSEVIGNIHDNPEILS